ncbi:MAG: hypothetical protein ACLFSB_16095 [Chitinispirillaceae bacterium]
MMVSPVSPTTAFATIPVAEQTDDGGLIERVHISADGQAESVVGHDNAGEKALY